MAEHRSRRQTTAGRPGLWAVALLWLGACGTASTKPGSAVHSDATPPATTDTASPDDCVTDADQFQTEVVPVLTDCLGCHREDGSAGGTRQVFVPGDDAANLALLQSMARDAELRDALLQKPTGQVSHGGGQRFDLLDPAYGALDELVARAQEPGGCAHPGEPAMTCDGTVRPGPSPLRRLTSAQFENAVFDLFSVELPPGIFPETTRPTGGFRTFSTNNTVSASGAESILLAAEAVGTAIDVGALAGCPDAVTTACARDWLREVAPRVLRRPVDDSELAPLESFFDTGLEAEQAARLAVMVMVQAPAFLYLDESIATEQPDQPGVFRRSDHAVAARLAFFLTDHPPDDALWAAAEAGALQTRDQVAAHARRLVADSRATAVVARFHQDWLHLDQLDGMGKDPDLHPGWGEDWIHDLRTETDLFTTEVVWSGDARFDTLMSSPTSWVTPELAHFYGVSHPGSGWHRTTLTAARRPGLLSRAAWLSAHGYAASSAPVRRGAFVLEQMLCEELAPPQDVEMELPEESAEAPTIRERLVAHWTDPSCSSCHLSIDPIGLSFEHYDAIGAWRDHWESGTPVDASGTLEEPAGDFVGAAEMLALVATSERARSCYAQRWWEHAAGRPAEGDDACTLRLLGRRFADVDGDIRALLVDVALADAMLYREIPDDDTDDAEEDE